nr:hypothetical protein [Tanacetum cinerariifolium]
SVKASSVVADKPSSVVVDKVDVVKDNINVVADKASDALKNKRTGKGKKPVVGKDKDKPKNITPDIVKEKFKPNLKQKVISLEILFLRLSKQEENPEFQEKRSGSDSSNSLELDTKSIKRLISKLEKKVKKQESDEESVPKKLTKKVEKEESDEESVQKKGDKIKVTPSKIHDMLGVPFGRYSLFDLDEREAGHEFVRKWAG